MSNVQILIIEDGSDLVKSTVKMLAKTGRYKISLVTPDRINHSDNGTIITLDTVIPRTIFTERKTLGETKFWGDSTT